jgi:hypothetical protein
VLCETRSKWVGDHVILATDIGLQVYDLSSGWDDLLAGNWSFGPDARIYTQLKPIPGDPDRLLGLSDLNQLFLIDLANSTTSRLSLPITSSRFRIDTADLGRGQFRLYLLASPDDDGFPDETANPGLATLYSLDIDRDFSGSTVTEVSPGVFTALDRSTQWMAWGYSIPDPADATKTVFRSSLWDALGQGTAIEGGNQWFHTNELLVDPVFPDKVYVGATTLGYLLHPSVSARQPQERGVNLHWDPAGFNSYVQRPDGTGSAVSPGSSGLSRAALDLWAQIGRGTATDRQNLSAFLDAAGSFNNKTHADAQLLYTDGSYVYYGNDGGLNRFLANPDEGAESVLLKGLGESYTWGEFRRDIEGGGFNPASPIGPFGLEMLPALGFYPANWENLNTDLVTNLYQGGSLNARGNRWITGAQDNGISVGSMDRYTPYLVSNGDGGAGFFGDSDALLAFTNQFAKRTAYRMLDEVSLGNASDHATVPIWQLNGPRNWTGTVSGNIIATLFKTHAVLIDNGSDPPSAGADMWAQRLPLFQPISGDQAVISGDQAAIADHFRRALRVR